MKNYFLIISMILFPGFVISQQTINATITHDGLQREYILYVPSSYSGSTSVSLVLNFHGYTMTANEQMLYADFRSIADTSGFIIAHPMGTNDNQGITFWNVGWGPETVDDIGFTSALIDSISSEYNIDLNRIYSTGMSNGGFMSYALACKLSHKIAAIASVTGSMGPVMLLSCQPQHPIPVMQIHGTTDGVVPYNGANFSLHIDSAINYWVSYNNCDQSPIATNMPNISILDGSTATHYAYKNGDNGVSVELFKIDMGGHTWPGSLFAGTGTNQDINASEEIWKFFSQYDINGVISSSRSKELNKKFRVYPNPVHNHINIESKPKGFSDYILFDLKGRVLISGSFSNESYKLDVSSLNSGVYILKVNGVFEKLIKL